MEKVVKRILVRVANLSLCVAMLVHVASKRTVKIQTCTYMKLKMKATLNYRNTNFHFLTITYIFLSLYFVYISFNIGLISLVILCGGVMLSSKLYSLFTLSKILLFVSLCVKRLDFTYTSQGR